MTRERFQGRDPLEPRYVARKKKRDPGILGRNIARLREGKMTQAELAAASGVTSIAMIESGAITSPRLATLQAIASTLGVTVDALWREEDKPGLDRKGLPPELNALLDSPEGEDITQEELDELRKMPARGQRPDVQAYAWALDFMRRQRG